MGTSGRLKVNGEGERGLICSMYFINLYESRPVKPVEIVLCKGDRNE
jgi:hypothetical protein